MEVLKEFKVVAVSTNTNSFGLYQMIVMARDGQTYKTCANQYNVSKQGDIIRMKKHIHPASGRLISESFDNHELTEQVSPADDEIINDVWFKEKENEKSI